MLPKGRVQSILRGAPLTLLNLPFSHKHLLLPLFFSTLLLSQELPGPASAKKLSFSLRAWQGRENVERREPGFRSQEADAQLCHVQAVRPWTSHLASLRCWFFIYERGIIILAS